MQIRSSMPALRRIPAAEYGVTLGDFFFPIALGERLGHLDTETVNDHVFLIFVGREQTSRFLAHGRTHGDDVECGEVGFGIDGTEEVGDAHEG